MEDKTGGAIILFIQSSPSALILSLFRQIIPEGRVKAQRHTYRPTRRTDQMNTTILFILWYTPV